MYVMTPSLPLSLSQAAGGSAVGGPGSRHSLLPLRLSARVPAARLGRVLPPGGGRQFRGGPGGVPVARRGAARRHQRQRGRRGADGDEPPLEGHGLDRTARPE